jgi:hypothetical protein
MIRLPIQELSQTAFAAFGQMVEQPARAADASGPGWDWWGEMLLLAADSRPYSIGYLNLRPADLRFDWAERHMRSAELLIPMSSDCLVYVGPPLTPHQPSRLPPLTRFQVFVCARDRACYSAQASGTARRWQSPSRSAWRCCCFKAPVLRIRA